MTERLSAALHGVINVIGSFASMIFETDYPGLTLSIGAVLIGFLLYEIGWDYMDFFTHTSETSVRYK